MAYIYCIVNNINGKKYIGKTNTTIEKRFTTHVRDSSREKCKHRALYRAFNKYGVQNFSIHKLEECKWGEASDREIYYIDLYDTFRNGYNETLGGDGSTRIDYDNVVGVYFKCPNSTLCSRPQGDEYYVNTTYKYAEAFRNECLYRS